MDETTADPPGLDCISDERLALLLDGRLSPENAGIVDAHLRACSSCDGRLGRLERDGAAGTPLDPGDPFLVRLKRLNWSAFGRGGVRPRKPGEDLDATLGVEPPAGPGAGLPRLPGYRVVREVGRGGMGVVYEATDLALGRRVALKVLADSPAAHRTGPERFRREARAAGRLHHTNIVPVFGVGEVGGLIYYVMQFIEGHGLDLVADELSRISGESRPANKARPDGAATPPTQADDPAGPGPDPGKSAVREVARALLSGHLAGSGPAPAADAPGGAGAGPDPAPSPVPATGAGALPGAARAPLPVNGGKHPSYFRVIAEIGGQVALALGHAHDRGIVHRDIKPSNLLLDLAGVVWITDFGLATSGDDGLTATGDILGTLRYMAPERFRGEGGPRSDVYALGMTLYELLTFRQAFDRADRLLLIRQIQDQEPPRPRALDPRIPRDLETIVLKAIEKDPRRRYASAADLGGDLRRFLAGEPIRARPVGEAERLWKWARRRPAVASLIGLVAASLLVGATAATAFALVADRRAGDARRAESRALASLDQAGAAEALAQAKEAEARRAQAQAIAERDNSRRLSASLAADRGLALAEEGRPEVGLHWLLEGLRGSPEPDGDFARMVRRNIASWMEQVPEPRWIRFGERSEGDETRLFLSPDGRSFVTVAPPPEGGRPSPRSGTRPRDPSWGPTPAPNPRSDSSAMARRSS